MPVISIRSVACFAPALAWYVFVRWASRWNAWAADSWWISTVVVFGVCYLTYRIVQLRASRRG